MFPDASNDASDAEGQGDGIDADAPAAPGTVERALDVVLAVVVGFAGLLGILAWQLVLSAPLVVVPDPPEPVVQGIGSVATGLGTATVGLLFLVATDRGTRFLDLERPDRQGVGYAVGGLVVLLVAQYGLQALFVAAGVEFADHSLAETVAENPSVLWTLVPASLLFVGPGEELLYRNVIQKSLYARFPTWAAIVVTSAVFALVHAFVFAGGSTVATAASLSLVFSLSLILGAVYARTGNLAVNAVVHGGFNVVQFLLLHPAVAASTGG